MPFLDEPSQVKILDYQARWPQEFRHLAAHVRAGLGSDAVAIDHVGSTSVPGLAAKDVIDLQVRVTSINEASVVWAMNSIGFRCRPEAWNKTEMSGGVTCRKLVFAPPAGQRLCNVHFRKVGAPNTRFALLFRDYLRADETARDAWGAFKRRLAISVTDLADYGQIKQPATEILIQAAEQWAAGCGWSVPIVRNQQAEDTGYPACSQHCSQEPGH